MFYETTANKTGELIIYIASRLKDKLNYGTTLLGKSLYFIDCMSYLRIGTPITNLKYIKQDYGPTPESAKFLSIRDDLVQAGDLQLIPINFFGKLQNKFIPTRNADINLFEKDELVLIDEVIERLGNYSASEISDYTHQMIAWIFAERKEELPFFTFLLSSAEPETKHFEWANKVIKSYNE